MGAPQGRAEILGDLELRLDVELGVGREEVKVIGWR